MDRRTVLRYFGSTTAAITLAGCTGNENEGSELETNTTTGTRTPSATAEPGTATESATGTTGEPTQTRTATETGTATDEPTQSPTDEPTDSPTSEPTDSPTDETTDSPTAEATETATETPSPESTDTPGGGGGTNSFKFGGDLSAWIGREPASIEGETNPTITMRAGETYEVTWVNADGYTHQFAIEDGGGTELVQSEETSEKGATVSVTFEATEQMATYYCTYHATSMSGKIRIES